MGPRPFGFGPRPQELAVVVEDLDRRCIVAVHLTFGWKDTLQAIREQRPIYDGDTAARMHVVPAEDVTCRWRHGSRLPSAVPANDAARSARRRVA